MALLHVDVCIIGDELAGVCAGALLANQGFRVAIINESRPYEAKALGEFWAPTYPVIWQIPTSGPFAAVMERLEIKAEIRQAFGPRSEFAVINDPKERLIVEPLAAKMYAELSRIFGPLGMKIAEQLEDIDNATVDPVLEEATFLHENGFWDRLRRKNRIRQIVKSGPFLGLSAKENTLAKSAAGAYISSVVPSTQYLEGAQIDNFACRAALQAFGQGTQNPSYLHANALMVIKNVFLNSLKRHGAEVIGNDPIVQVETKQKSIEVIRLQGANNFTPQIVVDATSSRNLAQKIVDKKLADELLAHENIMTDTQKLVILRALIPRTHIPRTFPKITTLCPNPNLQIESGIFGLFQPIKPHAIGRSFETESYADLVVAVLAIKTSATDKNALAEHVLAKLLPFVSKQIVVMDFLTHDLASSVWPQYQASQGHLNPVGGRPIYTPITNLFRAGRDIAPALGIHGEIAVGVAISQAVTRRLGKKKRGL